MRKIKRCPAKIGNPVKWRHLLRHWFTLYDKIKTVITFLLFDRFWQMTQICQIIFCEFFKKNFFTFFGYHLSDVITIGNVLEHLRHQWRHSSCPMGEMITNYFVPKSTLQCRDFGILIVQIGQETKKLWYFENDENSDDVIY